MYAPTDGRVWRRVGTRRRAGVSGGKEEIRDCGRGLPESAIRLTASDQAAVLRRTELDVRDVLYCAGPTFDCQGAMAVNMITAQIRRSGDSLARETFVPGDTPTDYEIDDLHGITGRA